MRPAIRGIAEAVLYTDDLAASRRFFAETLGMPVAAEHAGMVGFDAGTAQLLLVFDREAAAADKHLPGGRIPGHRGDGPAHLAFHVSQAEFEAWREALGSAGVPILSDVRFGACGRSLYFNDPAGNVLELATPGLWRTF